MVHLGLVTEIVGPSPVPPDQHTGGGSMSVVFHSIMSRWKIREAEKLTDEANRIVESAKEIRNEAGEWLRAAADAAQRATDGFAACALTINRTVITHLMDPVFKEPKPTLRKLRSTSNRRKPGFRCWGATNRYSGESNQVYRRESMF